MTDIGMTETGCLNLSPRQTTNDIELAVRSPRLVAGLHQKDAGGRDSADRGTCQRCVTFHLRATVRGNFRLAPSRAD